MMSCQGVRRRLSAFHDGELPTDEQVRIETHLRGCPRCAREVRALRAFGDALRDRVAYTAAEYEVTAEALRSEIVSRVRAERDASVSVEFGRMFEDMRLGFAALGSTAASFVSLLLVVGIFTFGPQSERPDSLAAMMQHMEPQTSRVDVRDLVGRDIVEPSSHDREAMSARTMVGRGGRDVDVSEPPLSEEDAVFALAAVVTRQGRIASLEVVMSGPAGYSDREQVLRLLDQVSRARLEPARVGGSPVASRTLWVMAHTTVRAKLPVQPKQSALSAAAAILS
jgi:hypothetical protein